MSVSNLLLELLNATLCKRSLNEKVFEGAKEADWQRCYDMALQQNVLAMTFPAMSSLPKELRPSFHVVVEVDGLRSKRCRAVAV